MGLLLIYLIGALSLSFLCSVLEAVLLSTPMSYISTLEMKNPRLASLMKRYKSNIDRPVSAILSLNTIAHTIGAAGVGAQAIELWGEAVFGIVSAVMTFLIFVLSEIIPKTIGAFYWRDLALKSTAVIRVLIIITYPLVWLSELITRWLTPKDAPASVSRDEVSAMVSLGVEEGVFKAKESKAIQSLIHLESVKAADIMTPQIVVESANASMTCREMYDDRRFTKSRIPVYDSDDDFISGYVLRNDVLEKVSADDFGCVLDSLKREILQFKENEPVSNIWEQMLVTKEHIVAITDGYSCLRGIITMEDIIETMLGIEIVDENESIVDMQLYAVQCAQEMRKSRETKR